MDEPSEGGQIADEKQSDVLEPQTLLARARATTKHALASGALQPIPAMPARVLDHGIPFTIWRQVRVGTDTPLDNAQPAKPAWSDTDANPFLPYDPDLFVSDLTPTHVCLLNKYNVLDTHLLLVTRTFEHQSQPLTVDDFEALRLCMAEFDGLGFYNAGEIAGASQRHKHLQYVPLPLAPGDTSLPISSPVASARWGDGIGVVDAFPFMHALCRLDGAEDGALLPPGAMRAKYRSLLAAVGIEGAQLEQRPYNLLVTREWMMVVPRSREAYQGISVNALGFAGSLFVRDDAQYEDLLHATPLGVLSHVGVARPAA